ncbi:MAG: SnoaL-like polyketide cyclase [Gammaproteobacteria bacterium]|jgi:hypothetical protein|nr:SnoaL-like polyketide cyclase [Gammaproteobacteria bacterium]
MKKYSFARMLLIFLFCFSRLSYADIALDQNAELVKGAVHDIWVNHEVDKIDHYYASDFRGCEEADCFNREQLKAYVKEDEKEYMTRSIGINDMVINGDKIAARMTINAVNKKTQKPVTSYAIAIYQVRDQKIAQLWLAAEPSLV